LSIVLGHQPSWYKSRLSVRECWQDLVIAVRRLRRAPAFTVFSVTTLALGIGATTAIYTVIYTVCLRPPALKDADRVVNLYHRDPAAGGGLSMMALSGPDWVDYQRAQTSLASAAAWARFRQPLVANGVSDIISGERVTGEYFAVVGFEAAVGRTLQPVDNQPAAARVIVLSDTLWRLRFAADPGIIGRIVNVGGQTFEVVGVMPSAFRGVDMPNLMPTNAWVPLLSLESEEADLMAARDRRWLLVKGRLKPGLSLTQAFAEARAIGHGLDREHPDMAPPAGRAPGREWFVLPATAVRVHESVEPLIRPLAMSIMIAVGLVLLVACTNIANLMLARASGKRHERAVRLALGASWWRLGAEPLAEALLLTAMGGLLAFAVARLAMTYLLGGDVALAHGYLVQLRPEFHYSTALVGAVSTLLALVVFGVVPVLHGVRQDIREALAGGSFSPRWRGRRSLIVGQVAVSSGLVAVAVLCAQQIAAAVKHDSGLDLDRLAIASVDFRQIKKGEAHGRRVLDDVLRLAQRHPGVDSVALSSGLPAGVATPGAIVAVTDERTSGMLTGTSAAFLASTPDIFRVLAVEIVAGRGFDARDTATSEPVVVLSRAMAVRLLGAASSLGRQVYIQPRQWAGRATPAIRTATVIGIAEDTDVGQLGSRDERGSVYVPFAQHYESAMTIAARSSSSSAAALPGELRRLLSRVDPDVAVIQASTGRDLDGPRSLILRIGAIGSGLLGGLALLLAMVGLYGLMAETVARRTREIGIWMALGADRGRVLRTILASGLRPALQGLALGAAFGTLLRFAFRPLFIRILPAFHPVVLVVVPVLFVGAALLASYLPARRATRVDPNVALRQL
jgi:putative ABC transport system permease protein